MSDPHDMPASAMPASEIYASEPVQVHWRRRAFAPELEAQFHRASDPATIRSMRRALILPAAVGIVMLWSACLSGPATLRVSLVTELLVNLPVAAAVAWLLRGNALTRMRQAAFVAAMTVRVACTMAEGHAASASYADRYVMAAGLTLFCTVILVPWRVPQAARFVLVAYPAFVLSVLLPFDAVARSGWDILAFVAVLLPVGLRVRALAESAERTSFLLNVRDQARVQELARTNERLHVLSNTDPLTGVGNRRTFDRMLRRVAGSGAPLGLLMIDADYFKRFNDTQGHLQGDECLRQLARAIRDLVRAPDHVARYGGEEFAVILHGATTEEAVEAAERIRRGVEALLLPHHARPDAVKVVTVSIGLSVASANHPRTPEQLMAEADKALYAAKDAGRNCIRRYSLHSAGVA